MKAFEFMCEGYRYVGNCTDGTTEPHLADMMDQAKQITFRTFVKAVGLDSIRAIFGDYQWGHGKDLRMKNDPYVTYYRSKYDGKPCYYVRHSGIEYIFVDEDHLDDDKDKAALIPISPNRWTIKGDGALLQGVHPPSIFDGTKTPDSLEISISSKPTKQAASTLMRLIKQSKLEMLTVDGEEEEAKETMKWLRQFV
jgi:hypothetical protein